MPLDSSPGLAKTKRTRKRFRSVSPVNDTALSFVVKSGLSSSSRSSDIEQRRRRILSRHPSPSSESSLPTSTGSRFPSPWDPTHFRSTTSSSSPSINSVPSTAPSASDDATHSLHLPLPISNTIRLPERLLVLPTETETPSITVRVPFWVFEYAETLVRDVEQWKTVYDLSDLPSLLATSEDSVSAHSDERAAGLTAEQLFNDYHATLNSNLATLRNAYIESEQFGERLTALAKGMPSMYISYHLRSLNIIQQERLAIRWALHDIVGPMAHWLGRPSSLLNILSKAVITPAPTNYKAHILTKKSVDTLIPGQWVDDNIINYFSGNVQGSHHAILGDDTEVLFCSPLFWTTLSHASNLKELALNSQVFQEAVMSKIRRILMPINVDQSHWILSYINLKDRVIQIYDSLINPPSTPLNTKNAKQWLPPHRKAQSYDEEIKLTKRWVKFLEDQFSLGQGLNSAASWNVEAPVTNAPIQGNLHDCGIYIIMFVRHLTSGFTVNHPGLPKEAMLGKIWISLTTARLRFWMELPKLNARDWEHVPDFLRLFPLYRPYAQMMLPSLPGV